MISILGTLLLSNITVTLPAEAHVRGSELTVGEIASVEGGVAQDVELVKAFSLGYAPSPGYSRVLRGWQIEQSLRKEFEELQFTVAGKAACRIWPSVATVSAEQIEAEARRALGALFSKEDVEITLKAALEDEKVPVGLATRELVAEPSTTASGPGTWSVPVKIVIDGMPYRTVWTTFRVDLYRVMPVLRRDIAPRGAIGVGDIVLRRAAVAAASGKTPLRAEELVGATAKRLLKAGQPVSNQDVNRVKAITEGEIVSLVVRNGLVKVSTQALALRDAYLGDVIPVRTNGGAKELLARVVASGRLELRIGTSR